MTRPESVYSAIVVLVTLSFVSCTGSQPQEKKNSTTTTPSRTSGTLVHLNATQMRRIRTQAVESTLVPVGSISTPGKVEANINRVSHIALPLTGRVTKVFVRTGDFVRQGQPLLTMESADAESAVSAYRQAQASTVQARSTLAKVETDFVREKDLFSHEAAPQKDLLSAEALAVQAKAVVDQAEAVVEQAKRRLQIIGIGPDSFGQQVTVHAPISGKLLEVAVVEGEFRNDLSAPVLTIADLSSVWVTSDVPEIAIRLVKVGEPVAIQLAAYPGETLRGRVTQLGDTLDPQKRTVKVRAELSNPDGRFKPEMSGRIQLTEETEVRPVVPAGAVIAADGESVVWREVGQGSFEKVRVTTGAQIGDKVAIISGLKPNERIVVDGGMLLSTGN